MIKDLCATALDVKAGHGSAQALIDAAFAQATDPANAPAFIRFFEADARATARAIDLRRDAGTPMPPLAGLAVSIKDLFDVAGAPTTAASRVLADALPAVSDCPAVARLRRAGASIVGHTNMTEFAFSGVGLNPHFGTPSNVATRALDATPRIPGGSTSGGAVSVAAGAAWAALGSDTGGSIRIPAALQGLVGFKNTARLTPTQGSIPLSPTLDTACAITRSVRDAVLMHEILSARRVILAHRPLNGFRFAVASQPFLDTLDATVATAFDRSLSALRAAGAVINDLELPGLDEIGRTVVSLGGFAAAEAWRWHHERLARDGERYDPRVASRMRRGASINDSDLARMHAARAAWIAQMRHAFAGIDAVLSPTVPIVAPPMQPLVDNDDAFFAANALLLRNPSLVNLLDGCALSLPCQAPDELPVGLMVWAPALQDDTVLDAALAIEPVIQRATGQSVDGGR